MSITVIFSKRSHPKDIYWYADCQYIPRVGERVRTRYGQFHVVDIESRFHDIPGKNDYQGTIEIFLE